MINKDVEIDVKLQDRIDNTKKSKDVDDDDVDNGCDDRNNESNDWKLQDKIDNTSKNNNDYDAAIDNGCDEGNNELNN